MKLGIILTPDSRSKAYLQKIITENIDIDKIIFMNDGRTEKVFTRDEKNISKKYGFDITESISTTLTSHGSSFKEFNFVDINHPMLIEYLKYNRCDYVIFTGGGILKSPILKLGPKFIHLHPGIVPQYRGSTCYYYSLLNEGKCGVTAFVMDEGLDTGPIIYQKIFSKPDHKYIDEIYDAHIRSETLIDILKSNLLQEVKFGVQNSDGETYFIIHPVLKHIAILNCITNKA